jgi:hypothetical protein
MSAAVIMNNFRVGKVRRYLGLTKSEYEKLRQFYSETESTFTIDKGFY